ncbi:LPD7 domain-containing protein [Caballeronia mineralivorans]|uniref:LPD7 domain-containing protein n=1 Tax=Caballeronia mineralivorans TaxID=2010198 RepID=UPI002AFF9EF1|nr:LPD7 domain-containing protein [Caballeronia mineralivorans]MEA3099127.1 hypothetical protein [Caballeronia mineralivorans]
MTESVSSISGAAAQQDPVINLIERDPPVPNDAGASSGSRERVDNLDQAARDAVAAHRRREFDAARARLREQAMRDDPAWPPHSGPQMTSAHQKQAGAVDAAWAPLGDAPQRVRKRYLRAGNQYFLKDAPYQLAFEDLGPYLVTEHNRPDVVASMVDMAQAKSWQRIRVSGHDAFCRETWLQATLIGIRVSGYEPKTADLARLNEGRREHLNNRIEGSGALPDAGTSGQAHGAAVPQQPSSHMLPVPPAPQVGDSGRVRAQLPIAAVAAAATTASPREASDRGGARDDVPDSPRESGELVEYGGAPYQHNPARSESYYVVYRDHVGANHAVWGADLERALAQSGAGLGERITLENLGKRWVSIEAPVVDASGRVIGQEEKEVYRNTWQIDVERPEHTRSVQSMSRNGAVDRAPGEIVSGAPRAPTRTPRHNSREESMAAQRAMQLAVIVAAMRAQAFGERSISRVEQHARRMIDAFHAEGVRVPTPKVFDPLAPSARGRHAPCALDRAANRELERAPSEPSAPPL